MIAALVIVALVASAQAYPGSDPLEQMLSVQYENNNNNLLTNFGNSATCLVAKIFEVKDAIDEAKKDLPLLLNIPPLLLANLAKCQPTDDWLDCRMQAIRDTWEGTQKDRDQLAAGGAKILKAVQDILVCFQDDKVQARNGAIRIQTFPARIEQ
ncbi:uncharacterized protein LOC113206380 [Frankliniella occidentalis]|uniref:Uncharacterized protein LOC113206380 n=1 Tax=Frankliniella occidentalis TaxID=133901 RepID=A0A6J1SFZ1_FRAOC|nr:uncharacterized protein LOC113206380 [Frankliniella occidentalis]